MAYGYQPNDDNMRSKAEKYFRMKGSWANVWSAVLMLLGLFLLVKPDTALRLICQVIGLALIVVGVFSLVRYFRRSALSFSPVPGIVLLLIGILFTFSPYVIAGFAKFVFGILILGSAVSEFAELQTLRAYNDSRWYLCLISGLISIFFAFFILFYPVEHIVVMIAGIALIYVGATGLLFHFRTARIIRNATAEMDDFFREVQDAADGRARYDENGQEIIDSTATVEDSDSDSYR